MEGESCIVSWCLGHLAEFLDETEKDKETEESTVVIPETTPETTPAAEEETK